MKESVLIIFFGLFFLQRFSAHHTSSPLEEWESKNGKEFTERYGTLNAGRRMAGYSDGKFTSADLRALSNYLSSDIPFYEQRNVIYALAVELKKDTVYFSLEEEKEVVGDVIKKLKDSEAQPDGRYRINLLKNGLKKMVGYYDPRLEQLSHEWAVHENSYVREGAEEYLQFVSENKDRSARESVSRLDSKENELVVKREGNLKKVDVDRGSKWPLVLALTLFASSLGYLGCRKIKGSG